METSEDFTFSVRKSRESDIHELHELLVESTGEETKVSLSSLYDNLFGSVSKGELEEVEIENSCFEIDMKLIHSNRSVCQAYVADEGARVIGFVIFHYFYSPWSGHYAFLDKLYTRLECRKKGVAFKLIGMVMDQCKRENLKGIFFRSQGIEPDLLGRIMKCNPIWYRNNEVDWSVCRIYF